MLPTLSTVLLISASGRIHLAAESLTLFTSRPLFHLPPTMPFLLPVSMSLILKTIPQTSDAISLFLFLLICSYTIYN